jgi:enoyl-CoA hydratase/carnithine racemase
MSSQFPDSYTVHSDSLSTLKLSHNPSNSLNVTPVVSVTLYRPNNNNAFTRTMSDELVTIFELLDHDPRVKAVVITGHGRHFCAGADLEQGFSKLGGAGREERKDLVEGLSHFRKPTIVAINGAAVGIGITLTLPFSVRVAYKDAKIGFLFARRGLVLEAGSTFYLPRMVGLSRANYLATTGAILKASDKILEGIITETLDTPEDTVKRAIEIAEDVSQNVSLVAGYACREMLLQGNDTLASSKKMEGEVISGLYAGK